MFITSQKAEEQNFRNVVYMGICFMVLFSAMFSGQNLMTQVYFQLGFGDLGKICFFTTIGIFACCSVISSYYVKGKDPLFIIKISAIPYALFIAAGVLATSCAKYNSDTGLCNRGFLYLFNIITAGGQGVASAFLWLCQSTYLASCATEKTRGRVTGTFVSIFETCQIISGLLGAAILGYTDQFTFYVILFLIMILATVMLTFMRPAVKTPEQIEEEKHSSQTEESQSLAENVAKFLVILRDQKYKFLLRAASFLGMGSMFYPVFLGQAVSIALDTDEVSYINFNTGLVFIILAMGEILGALLIGRLADKHENKAKLLSPTMIIYEAALIMTVLGCLLKSFTLILVSGFLWGAGEAAIGTMVWTIIGSKFKANPQLFAAFRFASNMSGAIMIVMTIILPRPMMYVIVLAMAFLAFHTFCLENLRKSEQEEAQDSLEEGLMVEMKVLA